MQPRSQLEGIRSVNRAAHSAFVSMDELGRISWWNPAAELLFGWTCDEVIGSVVADVLVPEEVRDAHWRGLERFLATGDGPILDRMIEVEALHRDGHRVPVEMTITSLRDGDGWTFHAFLRDASAMRRADALATEAIVEAALAAAHAAEYSRALADYHSIMRHRIGNPLTIIMGAATTLQDVDGMSIQTRDQLLGMILEAARGLEATTLTAAPVTPEEIGLHPRPGTREDWLVDNERFFRGINLKIAGSPELAVRDQLPLVCECSSSTCARVLYLPRAAFDEVRSTPDHYAITPGHEVPEIERVVDRVGPHWIVAKLTG